MIDVQTVDRAEFKRHQQTNMTEADMADEPEDPDAAAERLEAALERIARQAAARPAPLAAVPPDSNLSIPEIAERLDSLIGHLRAALGIASKQE
ncbi:MAG: hypothetical protein P4L90_07475 [Rhodopila sp.]|nr:hypothetical protein [Rhodopila sp.]